MMGIDVANIAFQVSIWALPVLLAITLHEAAHGWAAARLGDDTALRLGRVSANPLRHIDPFGTVLLPAMMLLGSGGQVMFGFAKPVPVNFGRLRRPRLDSVYVAAAGPAANILMALIATAGIAVLLPYVTPGGLDAWVIHNLSNAIWINLLLAVFNMLPIPPLDGGRVAVGLLPPTLARPLAQVGRYGIFIVLGVLFVLPLLGSQLGYDLNVFYWLIFEPVAWLRGVLLSAFGVA